MAPGSGATKLDRDEWLVPDENGKLVPSKMKDDQLPPTTIAIVPKNRTDAVNMLKAMGVKMDPEVK